ncbi:hypothetical protein E3N88_17229 [Mikania micrantha]|uniref:CCHC-type domain-containing protein n=1 Tax=Mikania micrantha TaxID=192012 RepID=A0A5N6NT27_9ASTR|nr:hypothetical protein E3N88_17229 [Mikania micrantha]
MSSRRQPSPPSPTQDTDPSAVALATLVTELMMTVLPGIITQVINGDENTRSFPRTITRTEELVQGETSKKRKRCRPRKSRDPVIYTEAIPLRQMAITSESESCKCYVGKSPLCASCHYHHRAEISCKQCTHCGQTNHWDHKCKFSMELVCKQNTSKFPLCATCGLHHAEGAKSADWEV